jgi:hypothetical protein
MQLTEMKWDIHWKRNNMLYLGWQETDSSAKLSSNPLSTDCEETGDTTNKATSSS